MEAKYKCVSPGHHHHHHTARVLNHVTSTASKKRDVNDQSDVSEEVETIGEEEDMDEEPDVSVEYELSDDEEVKKPRKAINMHQILKYITNEKIDTSEGDIMF